MKGTLVTFAALAALAMIAAFVSPKAAAEGARVPAPLTDEAAPTTASPAKEVAVLAGGCFWGVQGVFQHVNGVSNAVSGYAGGEKATAHYRVVGTGETGHAESVRIEFDPAVISYGRILQIYFSVAHDPTELNMQGPDVGPQYRSTIFAQNEGQARIAAAYIAQLDKARTFPSALATTIETGRAFFPAEDYHQDYLTLHPDQPYIYYNDLPKVAALKALFPESFREKPKLVAEAGLSN